MLDLSWNAVDNNVDCCNTVDINVEIPLISMLKCRLTPMWRSCDYFSDVTQRNNILTVTIMTIKPAKKRLVSWMTDYNFIKWVLPCSWFVTWPLTRFTSVFPWFAPEKPGCNTSNFILIFLKQPNCLQDEPWTLQHLSSGYLVTHIISTKILDCFLQRLRMTTFVWTSEKTNPGNLNY